MFCEKFSIKKALFSRDLISGTTTLNKKFTSMNFSLNYQPFDLIFHVPIQSFGKKLIQCNKLSVYNYTYY